MFSELPSSNFDKESNLLEMFLIRHAKYAIERIYIYIYTLQGANELFIAFKKYIAFEKKEREKEILFFNDN